MPIFNFMGFVYVHVCGSFMRGVDGNRSHDGYRW